MEYDLCYSNRKCKERMMILSEYTISILDAHDDMAMKEVCRLLEKEGIQRDKNLDITLGLYDEDYHLVATGSCFANTLRCLAVDSDHQGEGLMNQVVSELIQYEAARGITKLFLYTKCKNAGIFQDLGFYEVARGKNSVLFMENRRNGFRSYLQQLQSSSPNCEGIIGAVLMNANPFTLGHQYLLEYAASQCDQLHVFLVSEDVSLIPFSVRKRLVMQGTVHIPNLVFHETGSYLISNATFPSYFLKDQETVIRAHAQLDISIFMEIAKYLHISIRFVGEEPFSLVTGIYNQVMESEMQQAGIACCILPRKERDGRPISASVVRRLLREGAWEQLQGLVPPATLRFFQSREAETILQMIRKADDVTHY